MTLHVRAVYGPHFSCPKGWLAVFAEVELLAVLVVMTERAREQDGDPKLPNIHQPCPSCPPCPSDRGFSKVRPSQAERCEAQVSRARCRCHEWMWGAFEKDLTHDNYSNWKHLETMKHHETLGSHKISHLK